MIGRVVAAGAVVVVLVACAGRDVARTVVAQPTRQTAATTVAATSARTSGPARGSAESSTTVTTAITLPAVTAKPPTPVSSFPDLGTALLTDNRVFMVGDSVLESASPGYGDQLRRVLGPLGWRITIDAVEGRPASTAVDVVRQRRSDIGQVVVILIGNNYNGNQREYGRDLDRMLTLLDGVDKIVLLTVEEYRPVQAEVNAEIRRAAASDPRVVLVDWNTVAKTTPGVNRPDGLHLTNAGAGVLAATIADALGPAP